MMFYRKYLLLPGMDIEQEFHCQRCRRILRVYSIIGLSLLGIVVAVLAAFTIWAKMQA